MPVLECQGISKHFGAIHALDDVSLTISAGEVVGLMGDNGAGKSTLVKIVAGNFPPTAGRLLVDGQPTVFEGPSAARRAGSRSSIRIWPCATTCPPPSTSSWDANRRWVGPLACSPPPGRRRRCRRRAEVGNAPARCGARHARRSAGAWRSRHLRPAPDRRRRGARCARCRRLPATRASPSCSSATACRMCSRWPIASSCCAAAPRSPTRRSADHQPRRGHGAHHRRDHQRLMRR